MLVSHAHRSDSSKTVNGRDRGYLLVKGNQATYRVVREVDCSITVDVSYLCRFGPLLRSSPCINPNETSLAKLLEIGEIERDDRSNESGWEKHAQLGTIYSRRGWIRGILTIKR